VVKVRWVRHRSHRSERSGFHLSQQRKDEAMPKYIRNTGKPWTPAQVADLKHLAQTNTPTRVIGLKLGRTENAVRTKASGEGVSLSPPNRSPYGRRG
jgi:hypothetical protein